VFRIFVGLVKGAVLGAGIGYGAYAANLTGFMHWITYAVVGAVVGLLVGRPIWRHMLDKSSTLWTAWLKAIFGAGIGVGLYALVARVWGGMELTLIDGQTRLIQDWQFVMGGAIGALYGAFVELDDAPPKADEPKKSNSAASS
jgi:hypothetical protein